jgi:hypothetical protein
MNNLSALAALAITTALALPAAASVTNLVQNGNFEESTNGVGEIGYNTTLTGWSEPTLGYMMLATPSTAVSGITTQYGANNFSLWGVGNGGADTITAAPGGGNFVAMDGDFSVEPLQQTISGLTVGKVYTVTFDYAYAQQHGYTGATNQSLTVSLGDSSQQLATTTLPSEGFSGWNAASMNFTATGTSEVLSFLANGNLPVPPFALLSDVSMTAGVPEPATWAMMIVGVAGIGAMARRRRASLATA